MPKLLDAYSVQARYYPALIATIPGLAALAMMISWSRFGLTTLVATTALPVLVFAAADLARRLGKRMEEDLFKAAGGKQSITMLRYGDMTFDSATKRQYRDFLARKIEQPVPTEADEKTDVAIGDAFYERAGHWLRENTRDTKKFGLLFSENITYGFRRNLLGLKMPSLALNGILLLVCGFFLYRRQPLDMDDDTTLKLLVIIVLATVHSVYMALAVTRNGVSEASSTYARQLILSCETFIVKETKGSARKKSGA